MPLNTQGTQFPFERYLQSRQASLPGSVAGQAFGDINIPELLNLYQKEKAKGTLAAALSAMRGNPMSNTMPDATGGVAAGPSQNYTPEVPQMSAPTQPPQMGGLSPEIMNSLITLNPETGYKLLMDQLDPLKQAQTRRYNQLANGAGGTANQKTIYRNSETGETTDLKPIDMAGWSEYTVKSGQALQTLANQGKTDAAEERNAIWSRLVDNRQINEIVKKTGLTNKQQSALQTNNLRANRAVEVLGKPNITWQELALGEIDLAGIMQGGVPHVDEVKSTHYPGWQEQWAKWKTYANGHPTENVPEPIRKKVLSLVNGVVTIDNKFLEANAKFIKNTLGKTVKGGIKSFEPAIDEMTDTLKSSQDDRLSVSGFSVTP